MRQVFLALLLMPLVSCRALEKAFPQLSHGSSAHDALASDYTVEGVTVVDRQAVNPVRTLNSEITVRVLRPGETEWHTCNKLEAFVYVSTNGTVRFGNICYPVYDSDGKLLSVSLTNKPVAPTGTKYEIRSVLVSD